MAGSPSRRAARRTGSTAYGWAMAVLAVFGLIGLGAALLLPARVEPQTS